MSKPTEQWVVMKQPSLNIFILVKSDRLNWGKAYFDGFKCLCVIVPGDEEPSRKDLDSIVMENT